MFIYSYFLVTSFCSAAILQGLRKAAAQGMLTYCADYLDLPKLSMYNRFEDLGKNYALFRDILIDLNKNLENWKKKVNFIMYG